MDASCRRPDHRGVHLVPGRLWGAKAEFPAEPVPFRDVKLTDAFWARRREMNLTVTIPHHAPLSEETGRIRSYELVAAALAGATNGRHCRSRYPFGDSNVFRIIEAAT